MNLFDSAVRAYINRLLVLFRCILITVYPLNNSFFAGLGQMWQFRLCLFRRRSQSKKTTFCSSYKRYPGSILFSPGSESDINKVFILGFKVSRCINIVYCGFKCSAVFIYRERQSEADMDIIGIITWLIWERRDHTITSVPQYVF